MSELNLSTFDLYNPTDEHRMLREQVAAFPSRLERSLSPCGPYFEVENVSQSSGRPAPSGCGHEVPARFVMDPRSD